MLKLDLRQYKVFLILLSLFIINSSLYLVCYIYEYNHETKIMVDFELPLPDIIVDKYKITPYPNVEKVIITGEFSDWDPDNKNYEMIFTPKKKHSGKWEKELILPPGTHEYKFAVYIEDIIKPIWTFDTSSYRQVADGVDNFNSQVTVDSLNYILNISKWLFIILLFSLSITILRQKFKIQSKKILRLLIILVIIGNLLFSIIYYTDSKRSFTQLSYSITDQISSQLSQQDNINPRTVYKLFNNFLWFKLDKIGMERIEENYTYTSLILFDKEDNFISFDYRNLKSNSDDKRLSLEQIGVILKSYFEKQKKELERKNISIFNYTFPRLKNSYTKSYLFSYLRDLGDGTKKINMYNSSFLYPIINDYKIIGYLGIYRSFRNAHIIYSYLLFNGFLIIFIEIMLLFFPHFFSKEDKENSINTMKLLNSIGLTKRENEVISLLFTSASNKDIAEKLYISKRTVDNHIYNILKKAGVKTRLELLHKLNRY
ncbi:MAG: hypothetical protein B6229_01870 [Spirochaetaceae bacterium 4572_7]|nr:MAG: hypothetical protein B6229_01870 [Spirochaetaceae bacterium 4572_7]